MKRCLFIVVGLLLMAGLTWAGNSPSMRPSPRLAADCVEVDIEAPAEAYLGDDVTLYGEVTNCGDDAGLCELTGTLTQVPSGSTFVALPRTIYLAAGETQSKTVKIRIPNNPLLIGTYTACVTATIGTAEDTDCTTTEILALAKKSITRTRAPRPR